MRVRILIVIVAMVFLVGCAEKILMIKPGPEMNFTEDEKQRAYKADNYTCTRQSVTFSGGGGGGLVGVFAILAAKERGQRQANEMYRLCMEAKGWVTWEEEAK